MSRNEENRPGKLSSLELKTREKRSWERVLKAQYLIRPITIVWTINILTALAILFIVTHPREKTVQRIYDQPAKPDEPVIARLDFKIPRDLEVPDLEGTEKNKQDAAARTRSIYDYAPSVRDNITKRISAFFGGFRELYPPSPEATPGEQLKPEDQPIKVPPVFMQDKEQELLRNFGVPVSTEDLDALKARFFGPELETALVGLIEEVYQGKKGQPPRYVVPTKELLLKDSAKGVLARRIDAPPDEASIEITNMTPILDISSAQELIESTAKDRLSDLKPSTRKALVNLAKSLIEPNLTFNKKKTEEAKDEAVAAVKPLYYKFKKDEVIVRKGDRLSAEMKKKVDAIIAAQRTVVPRSFRNMGLLATIILLISSVAAFATRNIRKFRLEPKDMVFLAIVLVLSLAVLKGVDLVSVAAQTGLVNAPEGLNYYYIIPLAGAVMLVRMVLNSEIALGFAFVLSILGGVVVENNLFFAVYTLIGSTVAAGEVRQCRQRSTILRAGLVLGIVNVLLILVIGVATNAFVNPENPLPNASLLWNSLFGLAGGVFASVVVTGLVPVAESVFSYATDIKLLELLNQDNPLLKKLSLGAPGTHQHSLMVANLAEAAAEAIGANPLLARVCAMYHDLGKMNKPQYFAENQWDGVNVHERLSPSMSTLVIHNHVKEGAEMGEKAKLPMVVIECIQQHHGTSLLKFFFEKAKELNSSGMPLDEMDYRYAGPKPQTRETAIIMLADVVESAARTVRDPSPARLQGMVQKLINRFFTDGQLDECDLTLKNLHDIAKSFNKTLSAIYHNRPDYPEPVVKGQAADKKKKAEADASGPKDKEQKKNADEPEKDSEDAENYLKRLGL